MVAPIQGRIRLEYALCVDGARMARLSALSALGLRSGFGDEHLRLVGVKAFVDGACAGGNCLVEEPFEGTEDHGMQTMATEALEHLVAKTARDGVVLAVHANGDRAIRLLLDAHERARTGANVQQRPVPRHRIKHCTVVGDEIIGRIKAPGLIAVPFGPTPGSTATSSPATTALSGWSGCLPTAPWSTPGWQWLAPATTRAGHWNHSRPLPAA